METRVRRVRRKQLSVRLHPAVVARYEALPMPAGWFFEALLKGGHAAATALNIIDPVGYKKAVEALMSGD